MKKIICSLLVLCLMVLPVISESWADTDSFKIANDYDRRALEAFDKGDYALALELSEYAEVKRTEIELVINEKIEAAVADAKKVEEAKKAAELIAKQKREAEELAAKQKREAEELAAKQKLEAEVRKIEEVAETISLAQNQLVWAKNAKGDVYYPMSFTKGEQSIQNAVVAFAEKEYDSALFYAREAISVLSEISEVKPLPKYYVVRPWEETKDCYWNISGRSYVYNDPTLWENLYNANKSKMEDPSNPDLIHPGMKIEIPSIAGEIREGTYDSSIIYDTFSAK